MARPPAAPTVDEELQHSLLNLETNELDAYWVDPQQPLLIPVDPLHYEAHELQKLLQLLTKQAKKNPAQFNSKNYIDVLDKLSKLWQQINDGGKKSDSTNDTGAVGDLPSGTAPPVGENKPTGLDPGVPAENPLPW